MPVTRGDTQREMEKILGGAQSAACMALQSKLGKGKLSSSVVGSKEWWPSHETIESHGLHVGLFWQLPRVYFEFWSNAEGGKRMKDHCLDNLKALCRMPDEEDEDYEEIVTALARWDVYLRCHVYKCTEDLDEKLRCMVAVAAWCQHAWKFLSKAQQEDIEKNIPQAVPR